MSRFTADPASIYLTDNGRALCGKHLGSCAAATGRDISGQKIHRCTAADHAAAKADGWTIACEECDNQMVRARGFSSALDGPKGEKPVLMISAGARWRRGLPKGTLGRNRYQLVGPYGCEGAVPAIYMDGPSIGVIMQVCANPKCRTHGVG